MSNQVITHDEQAQGWTAFHSFAPDMMVGMNNQFFSFVGGKLFIHNSDKINRNIYYDVEVESKISTMVNVSPSEVKEMMAIRLEGNRAWDASIQAYVSSLEDNIYSTIKLEEFIQKEGMWYAHTRRSEDDTRFDSKSTYGIGRVLTTSLNTFTFNGENSSLTVGDKIIKGSTLQVQGTIIAISGNTISLDTLVTLAPNDFILGAKDTRVEGASLRGYTFRVDLVSDYHKKLELFSVGAEIIKSFTP